MSSILESIDSLRQQTVDLLKHFEQTWTAADLPERTQAVVAYHEKLTENSYKVLVVGEAKRGKSTFVNAVIGKDLLPTDVDIATSQVFRVRHADEESVRLRFEDGSAQPIPAAEIPRYGSQVLADTEEAARLDEFIRWIEIDVPVRFLPREIELLDTPGLGSLYSVHAQITQRLVPQADGVIFVLGSNHPASDIEVDFLEKVLEVTRHVFFIQTMVDQHRREHWQAIQRRNEEIVQTKFGDRLGSVQVWPISSVNLRKAVATEDEDYLKVSRFPDLAIALRLFLFRVAGWATLTESVVLAQQLLQDGLRQLTARQAASLEESKERRRQWREKITNCRREFEENWGVRGSQRQGVMQSIQRHAQLARQSFLQTLHPTTGSVAGIFLDRIGKLQSLDEARQLAERMNQDVLAAACNQWREVCETAQSKAREELAPLIKDVCSIGAETEIDISRLQNLPSVAAIENRYFERMKLGIQDGRVASTAVGIPLGLATFFLFPALAPVAIGGVAVAFLAGAIRGPLRSMSRELDQAKQQLTQHLSALLQHIQQRFLAVDAKVGRFSLVEEFFQKYVQDTADQVESLTARKRRELQEELERLDAEARLSEEQRQEKASKLEMTLEEFRQLGQQIDKVAAALGQLDKQLAVPTAERQTTQRQQQLG